MRELIVKELEAGQRLDKFLHKYMKEAPNAFLYKMMRKKNIVLNGKKVTGNEQIKEGDCIRLFMSEETIEKFSGETFPSGASALYLSAFNKLKHIRIVAEYEDVLFVDKPAGVLSQLAEGETVSANEWLVGYLLSSGQLTEEDLKTFKPSVCNRLDRNTTGLLVCSKTLCGSQEMARILKDRSLHKYYRCVVKGDCKLEGIFEAYLYKDKKKNKVTLAESPSEIPQQYKNDAKPIKTGIRPICTNGIDTEMEVELFTGKTHQIRAQFEKLGYPLRGDVKYTGGAKAEKSNGQLLHAYRLVFPVMSGKCAYLSEKEIVCIRKFII